jgi:hypothetical protein
MFSSDLKIKFGSKQIHIKDIIKNFRVSKIKKNSAELFEFSTEQNYIEKAKTNPLIAEKLKCNCQFMINQIFFFSLFMFLLINLKCQIIK